MHLQRSLVALLLTAFFCFPVYLISRVFGAPARNTGGEFPGETSCAQSACHGGMANSGDGSVSITVNGVPVEDFRYTPGETVPVVVTVSDPGPDRRRWGFQVTSRSEADRCQPAGSIGVSPNDNQVQVIDSMGSPDPCPPTTVQYATHTFPPKSGGSGASYEVNWTAPAEDIGPVIFAAAGNAANGNNQPTGDNIYTTQTTVQPAAGGGADDPPSISSGGVVVANLVPAINSISANTIISIFGSNFAPEGTADIEPELNNEGRVATNQNGVCVEINGERSPILHVFPAQLNLQAPTLDALGQVSVEVITGCDTGNELRSPAEPVMVEAVTPAFFVVFNGGDGGNPIAALHGGGPDPVTSDVPAAPGEFISLFATGFGPTDPALQAGEIPMNELIDEGGLAEITADLSVTVGGIPVPPEDVFYAGVAPCCAGLYQLVVRVPESTPDGNQEVVATVDGASTPEGTFIPVQEQQ